jgi:uncharacterized membrane protein
MLATAAGRTCDAELLATIWAAAKPNQMGLPALAAFANAAGSAGAQNVLHEVWAICGPRKLELGIKEWCSLAGAAGQVHEGQLVRRLWEDCHLKPEQTDAWFWGTFATAAGEVHDAALLGGIWRASKPIRGRLGPVEWASFATACENVKARPLLREVWADYAAIGKAGKDTHWGSFAVAAGAVGDADLLVELWRVATQKTERLPSIVVGAFANATSQLGLKDFLKQVWVHSEKIEIDEHTIEALGSAAGKVGDIALLQEVWKKSCAFLATLSPKTWGSMAYAAGQAGATDLFREIWQRSAPWRSAFKGPEWASFAIAAGSVRDPQLVGEIWDVSATSRASWRAYEWGSFAVAAGRAGAGRLLWQVWGSIGKHDLVLDSVLMGSLADAAGSARDERLLLALWDAARPIRDAMDAMVWASFAKAAARIGKASILRPFWETARNLEWNVIQAGAFVTAAGDVGSRQLLREMWTAWWPQRKAFDLQLWACYATAAGKTRDPVLVRAVWRECEPHRRDLDAVLWGALATAAGTVGDHRLLQILWGACKPFSKGFDSKAWGSFAMASARINDAGLLREVWNACRDPYACGQPDLQATFATAAAGAGDVRLLEEVWTFSGPDREHFGDVSWASFVTAARRLGQSKLVRAVCEAHGFHRRHSTPALWGAMAAASAAVHDQDLVRKLWSAPAIDRRALDPRALAAFASAARQIRDGLLLRELWNESSSMRPRFDLRTWRALERAARDLGEWELEQAMVGAETECALRALRSGDMESLRVQLAALYRKREFGQAFLAAVLGRLNTVGENDEELSAAIATYLMRGAIWGAMTGGSQDLEDRLGPIVDAVFRQPALDLRRLLFRFLFAARGAYLECLDELAIREMRAVLESASARATDAEIRDMVLRQLATPTLPASVSKDLGPELLASTEWVADLGWEGRPCCFDPVREEYGVVFVPPLDTRPIPAPGLVAWRLAKYIAEGFWPGVAAEVGVRTEPVWDTLLGQTDGWTGSIGVGGVDDRLVLHLSAQFRSPSFAARKRERLFQTVVSHMRKPMSLPNATVQFDVSRIEAGVLEAVISVGTPRQHPCMAPLQRFLAYMVDHFQAGLKGGQLERHREEALGIWTRLQLPDAPPASWVAWLSGYIVEHALLASWRFLTDRDFHRALHDLKRKLEVESETGEPQWSEWLGRLSVELSRVRMSRLAAFAGHDPLEPIELQTLLAEVAEEEGVAPPALESSAGGGGSLWLWGQSDLLRRALLCLVHNAVTAAGSPDYVKMGLEIVERIAQITIMNPEGSKALEGLAKTGYGLADARAIIEDHGGQLQDPLSEPAQVGPYVTVVSLPLAQDPNVEGGPARE